MWLRNGPIWLLTQWCLHNLGLLQFPFSKVHSISHIYLSQKETKLAINSLKEFSFLDFGVHKDSKKVNWVKIRRFESALSRNFSRENGLIGRCLNTVGLISHFETLGFYSNFKFVLVGSRFQLTRSFWWYSRRANLTYAHFILRYFVRIYLFWLGADLNWRANFTLLSKNRICLCLFGADLNWRALSKNSILTEFAFEKCLKIW